MSEIINNKKVTLEQLNITRSTIDICAKKNITLEDVLSTSVLAIKGVTELDNIYLKELMSAAIDTLSIAPVNTKLAARQVWKEQDKLEKELAECGLNKTHARNFWRAGYTSLDEIKGLSLGELRNIRGIGPEAVVRLYESGYTSIARTIDTLCDFVEVMDVYGISKRVANLLWYCRNVRRIDQIKKLTPEELIGDDGVLTRMDVHRIKFVFPCETLTVEAEDSVDTSITVQDEDSQEVQIQEDISDLSDEAHMNNTPLENLFLPVQLHNKLIKVGITSGEKLIETNLSSLAISANLSSNQTGQLVKVCDDLKTNKSLGFAYSLSVVNESLKFYKDWLNMVKAQSKEVVAYRKLLSRLSGYFNYIFKLIEHHGITDQLTSTQKAFMNAYTGQLEGLRYANELSVVACGTTKLVGDIESVVELLNKYAENTYYTGVQVEV